MNINCTYDCLYQIDGKCCLTDVPKNFVSTREGGVRAESLSYALSYYDGDCPYRTIGACGSFRGLMLAFA